jgi:hypothetical protein
VSRRRKRGKCGTLTGRDYHLNRGEPTCAKCRAKFAAWQRRYKKLVYLQRGPMLVPALGTHRRIQALARLGWSYEIIGQDVGITARAVGNVLDRRLVHRRTAARIRGVYDRRCMTPGPSHITAKRAAAKDWASPLAWDDIDNPHEIPRTPQQEREERAEVKRQRERERKRSRRNAESRRRINAQNYQRRKARRQEQAA